VSARNDAGSTALHLAAAEGKTDVAVELLRAGADVNAVDGNNWTPLLHASMCVPAAALLRELIAAGADLRYCDPGGWTALHVAAASWSSSAVSATAASDRFAAS